MGTYEEILGEQQLSKNGFLPTSDTLKGAQYVALYFAAAWCPNSALFTPKLEKVYNYINKDFVQFEVVLISGDDDEQGFRDFYETQPWLAVKWDKEMLQEIFVHYDATSMPLLVLIDRKGDIKSKRLKQDVELRGTAVFESLQMDFPSPTKENR